MNCNYDTGWRVHMCLNLQKLRHFLVTKSTFVNQNGKLTRLYTSLACIKYKGFQQSTNVEDKLQLNMCIVQSLQIQKVTLGNILGMKHTHSPRVQHQLKLAEELRVPGLACQQHNLTTNCWEASLVPVMATTAKHY